MAKDAATKEAIELILELSKQGEVNPQVIADKFGLSFARASNLIEDTLGDSSKKPKTKKPKTEAEQFELISESEQKKKGKKPMAKAKETKPAKKDTSKRFDEETKKEAVAYIKEFDAEHGRGGKSAAAKKFGTSPLTIGNWWKKYSGEVGADEKPKSSPRSRSSASASSSSSGLAKRLENTIKELQDILEEVKAKDAKLEALRDIL